MATPGFQHPKPGKTIKVIGAGLPRTGTNSFCAALEILLDGPSYHAGCQYAGPGSESEIPILTMIELSRTYPYDTPAKKKHAFALLEKELSGYVSTNDPPLSTLVPELMELYPDALVIVTTRDRDSWAKSIVRISNTVTPRMLAFIYFWVPRLRHLPTLVVPLGEMFRHVFGVRGRTIEEACEVYDRHREWIEKVVPKEKLVYYSVREGWGPLCEALGKEVPDVEFPRMNEAAEVDEYFKKLAQKGLWRWGMVFSGVLVPIVAGVGWRVWG